MGGTESEKTRGQLPEEAALVCQTSAADTSERLAAPDTCCKDHHPTILAVGDHDIARTINGHAARAMQLAWALARFSDSAHKAAVLEKDLSEGGTKGVQSPNANRVESVHQKRESERKRERERERKRGWGGGRERP